MVTVPAGTWLILVIISGAAVVQGWLFRQRQVCYGTLGCFSGRYPYTNTNSYLPRAPSVIGTSFLLFTRNSSHTYEEIMVSDKVRTDTWTTFRDDRQTVIIIHGYFDYGLKQWVLDMVDALLTHGDFNVIVVDWAQGAKEVIYLQSAANIRVVGAQVAGLIKHLGLIYDTDPSTIHIIGHSLGAHAAGYAGERIEGIGRITGLDPAGPAFIKTNEHVRLDPSDAVFVDVIHTDDEQLFDLGFGMNSAIGTVDFYPNGGRDQPGCPGNYYARMKLLFSLNFELGENFACSHLRALDLFTESINSDCSFLAFPCKVTKPVSSNMCRTCDGACAVMGFHTNTSTTPGKYFIETNSSAPFCIDNS